MFGWYVSVGPGMAMHVIIDGYNILGVRGWSGNFSSQESEQCRERLLQDLSRYSHRKGHSLTVVFDAWRQPHGEHREHRSGVQVLFTKEGERADQVIQRMARQYTRDCVVVSSDLEIVATAKAHGHHRGREPSGANPLLHPPAGEHPEQLSDRTPPNLRRRHFAQRLRDRRWQRTICRPPALAL